MNIKSPKNVVAGNIYPVPTGIYGDEFVPIMFPAHIDGEEICVTNDHHHYHIDHRFSNKPPSRDDNIIDSHLLQDIRLREMMCYKSSTVAHNENPFAIVKLHEQYGGHKLKSDRCPHQGAKLVNGCGTCPFHGMVWDFQTRHLKYKAPFYLRNGNQKWKISGDFCAVEPTESYVRNGENVIFELMDGEGKLYPNSILEAKLKDFEIAHFSC